MEGGQDQDQMLMESLERPVCRLDTGELQTIIDIARRDGVKVVDWCTRGIPQIDVLTGEFQVRPELAGEVVSQFLRFERTRFWLELFPYGIPFPDLVRLRFRNVGEVR